MYKVVEFEEEENLVEIIQNSWMIEKDLVFFPPLNQYFKYIKNLKTDISVIKEWRVYKTRTLKENLGKLIN